MRKSAIQTVRPLRRLSVLEAIIERGKVTFIEVGLALREIRDGRLYKKNYSSFEEYCQTRWGWSRQNAHKYIGAANFVDSEGVNNCYTFLQ